MKVDDATLDRKSKSLGEQRFTPYQLNCLSAGFTTWTNNYSVLKVKLDDFCISSLIQQYALLSDLHPVLRLKLRSRTFGEYSAFYKEFDSSESYADYIHVTDIDSGESLYQQFEQEIARLNQRENNLVSQWLLIRSPNENWLIWIINRLFVDLSSWNILLDDFSNLSVQNLKRKLEDKSSAGEQYRNWAAKFYDLAHNSGEYFSRQFWTKRIRNNTQGYDFNTSSVSIGKHNQLKWSDTSQLADDFSSNSAKYHRFYQTEPAHLIFTCLSLAVESSFVKTRGSSAIDVDLCVDVRYFESGKDISSDTVGCGAIEMPINLPCNIDDLGRRILDTKKELESVLSRGCEFGALTAIEEEDSLLEQMESRNPSILVRVNQSLFGSLEENAELIAFEDYYLGVSNYWLVIDLICIEDRHEVRIGYTDILSSSQIETFIEGLRTSFQTLISHFDFSLPLLPSAFPLADVTKSDLKRIQEKYPGLKDLYSATAMQQGLVSLSNTVNSDGIYTMQVLLELGHIDNNKLMLAFQALLQKHDVLRTVFEETDNNSLLQVVLSNVDIDWQEKDLISNEIRFENLVDEERKTSFDTTRSLMRFLLIKKSEDSSVLIWTHHHALLDGWSLTVLMDELSAIYTSMLTSDTIPEATSISFKRYVEWSRMQDYLKAERFWKRYLKGFSSVTKISFARENIDREYKQRILSECLAEELTQNLQILTSSLGLTLSSIVQLAWGVVLSKFSRENEVLFGYAVNGRSAEIDNIEKLVGMCLNSLPMRLTLSSNRSPREHLIDLRQQLVNAQEVDYLPYEQIQKLGEIPSGTSLFDSLVTMENMPQRINGVDNKLEVKRIETLGHNNFGLNLVVHPGKQLKVDLVYNSINYSRENASSILKCFCQVLLEIDRKIDCPIDEIVALNQSQIDTIYKWNDRSQRFSGKDNIWDHFVEGVPRNRFAHALVHGEQVWSYDDLLKHALSLQQTWRVAGVKPNSFVAIALPKSPEFVSVILSLHAMGCTYVPLALDSPKERSKFILQDADIQWIISDQTHIKAFSEFDVSTLNISLIETNSTPSDLDVPATTGDAPAYVIYTSGTTGKPKGVVISHKNIVNFCRWVNDIKWIVEGSKVTQFAPLTFDASAGELFASLYAGAELHLLDDELIKDPNAVSDYIRENNISFSAFPPDYLDQMNPECVDRNNIIVTAGSAPSRNLINTWKQSCRYINAYGPTESTVLSSFWEPNEHANIDRIYIGCPISNTEIYIVDQYGQLCADGVVGEIWIGGEGVAQGYLNLAKLNSEKFVKNNFWGDGLLYKTGDLGRRYYDGNIEIVGREDHQVKIRGNRIELGEIESIFLSHLYIDTAKAMAVDTLTGQKRLAIYLVFNDDYRNKFSSVLTPGQYSLKQNMMREFRDYARNLLPDYMVPTHYIFLAELPKTENGKIDLKHLPEASDDSVIKEVYVSARNDLEKKLVNIWSDVLGSDSERLGVHDNFFEAGGDSLKVMVLVKKIFGELGIDIPPAKIFRYPSIELLCKYLGDSTEESKRRTEAVRKGKTRIEKLKRKKARDKRGLEV